MADGVPRVCGDRPAASALFSIHSAWFYADRVSVCLIGNLFGTFKTPSEVRVFSSRVVGSRLPPLPADILADLFSVRALPSRNLKWPRLSIQLYSCSNWPLKVQT